MTSPPSGATHEAPAGAVGEDGIEHDAPPCLVALDAFSGPLDLLLFLVRRAEVDVVDIPIEDIADQYIATVAAWADLDLDLAGDFILMAATLLEIKSRLIAPPSDEPQEDAADEEVLDLRSGLVAKLLAYRRCKEAALALAQREDERNHVTTRQLHEDIPDDPDELGIDLENADPYALAATWEGVLARIQGLGPRTVMADPLPLETAMAILVQTLETLGQEKLSHLFATQSSRLGRVTLLMAVLECVRQRLMLAAQHGQYEDIELSFRPASERAIALELPPEAIDSGKRRRRPPLITIASAVEAADEHEEGAEEVVETDEQRFMRELEESCRLETVLAQCADLDQNFARFWALKRGLPWPPPAPIVVEPVRAPEPVVAPVAARPPRRSAPSRAAADPGVAPVVGEPVVAAGLSTEPAATAASALPSADLPAAGVAEQPAMVAASPELSASAPETVAAETPILPTATPLAVAAATAEPAATTAAPLAFGPPETAAIPRDSVADVEQPLQRDMRDDTQIAATPEPHAPPPVVPDAVLAPEPVSVDPAPETPTHPEMTASTPAAARAETPRLPALSSEPVASASVSEPLPAPEPVDRMAHSGRSDDAEALPADLPDTPLAAARAEPDDSLAPEAAPIASTPPGAAPGMTARAAERSAAASDAPGQSVPPTVPDDAATVVAKDLALPAMVSIAITPAAPSAGSGPEPVTLAAAEAQAAAQVPLDVGAAPASVDRASEVRADADPDAHLAAVAHLADASQDESGLIIELPEATAAVVPPLSALRIPSERLRVIDPLSTPGAATQRRADVVVDEQQASGAADAAAEWVEIEAKIDAGTEAATLAPSASVALHLPELHSPPPGAPHSAPDAQPPGISVAAQSISETTLSPTQQRTRATTLHPFPAPRPAKRQGRRLVLSATMLLIAATWYLSTHLPHAQALPAEPLAAAAPASPIDLPKAPPGLPIADTDEVINRASAQLFITSLHGYLASGPNGMPIQVPLRATPETAAAPLALPAPVATPAAITSTQLLAWLASCAQLAHAYLPHLGVGHAAQLLAPVAMAPVATTAPAPLAPDAVAEHDAEALRALPYRQEPLMSSAAWLVIGAWRAEPAAPDVP